ncbi:hypothetical protein BB560_003757, partial [Smittium megazygosporum]
PEAKEANKNLISYIQNWIDFNKLANLPTKGTVSNSKICMPEDKFYFYTKPKGNESQNLRIEVDPNSLLSELAKLLKHRVSFQITKSNKEVKIASRDADFGPISFLFFLKKYGRLNSQEFENEVSNLLNQIIDSDKLTNAGSALSGKLNLKLMRQKEREKSMNREASQDFSQIFKNHQFSSNIDILYQKKNMFSPHNNRKLVLNRRLVHFDSKISPRNWAKILGNIEENLHFLDYQSWMYLPIMIVKTLSDAISPSREFKYPGFVILAADQDVKDWKKSLDIYLNDIKKIRMQINLSRK